MNRHLKGKMPQYYTKVGILDLTPGSTAGILTKISFEKSMSHICLGHPLGLKLDRCVTCNLDGISCRYHSNAKRFCTKIILFLEVSQEKFHARSMRVVMTLPVQNKNFNLTYLPHVQENRICHPKTERN